MEQRRGVQPTLGALILILSAADADIRPKDDDV